MILIDGDIVAHRAAWATKDDTVYDAADKVDEVMDFIFKSTMFGWDDDYVQTFISGDSKDNFRYDLYPDYKDNRKGGVKPPWLEDCFEYLVWHYDAIVAKGQEADDDIVQAAYDVGFDRAVIASIDKDFNQVPCSHFNFYHNKFYKQSEWDAHVAFYTQVLTGDRQDNIPGLHRVGPKTAEKMLSTARTEYDLYRACQKAYGDYGVTQDELERNANLLWLRREKGVGWNAPSKDT